MFTLQKKTTNFVIVISTEKPETMLFLGQYLVRSNKVVDNKRLQLV